MAGGQPSQPGDLFHNGKRSLLHFCCICVTAEAESHRCMDFGAGKTQSFQDVRRFYRRGRAGRTGRECHLIGQGDDQGFTYDGWDAYIQVSGQTMVWMPIESQVRNPCF